MSCSTDVDLKAYLVGELAQRERTRVEDHVLGCPSCREELDRLEVTRSALSSLEDEQIPRRIAFVSDRVFEPRWYQTMWHSGPVMGLASAALLAGAILVHGFIRPAMGSSSLEAAEIEKRVEIQLNTRLQAALNQVQAQQTAELAKLLEASERQRKAELATFQEAVEYYQKQVARFEVASNEAYRQ